MLPGKLQVFSWLLMFVYNERLFDRINEMWSFKPYRKPMIEHFYYLEKQLGRLFKGCNYDCDKFSENLYANCMLRLSHVVAHGPASTGSGESRSGTSRKEIKKGHFKRVATGQLDLICESG